MMEKTRVKQLSIAFIIYIILSLVLFTILRLVDSELGLQVFPSLAVLIPLLFEVLKDRVERENIRKGLKEIISYGNFGYNPILMFVYTIVIVISLAGLFGLVGTNVGEDSLGYQASFFYGTLIVLLVFLMVKWVAERCRGNIYNSLSISFLWLAFIIYAMYQGNQGDPDYDMEEFFYGTAFFILLFAIAFCWGRVRRKYAYIEYLYKSVHSESRKAMLGLLKDEIESYSRKNTEST